MAKVALPGFPAEILLGKKVCQSSWDLVGFSRVQSQFCVPLGSGIQLCVLSTLGVPVPCWIHLMRQQTDPALHRPHGGENLAGILPDELE